MQDQMTNEKRPGRWSWLVFCVLVTGLLQGLWDSPIHANPQSSAEIETGQPESATAEATAAAALPERTLLNVPLISQLPELYNGCEVTSLAMLVNVAGHPVDKLELARNIRKDPAREQTNAQGQTLAWGNPNTGFVGDVTGASRGYSVNHGPIAELLSRYLPNRVVDLTGHSFDELLNSVAGGKPVVVWTTENFGPTDDWVTWKSPSGDVRATFSEHCVLLVGYDATTVTVNDPLDNRQKQVNRENFVQSWEQLGKQAVTYQ
ncbi:C39 family peptidase [Tumebacillus sp. ITR2]|uniref:C39 family peptidase n=1 Tax=Tumebacillus amylolyticus TaxID=2801339 RepID=A0ABS1J6L5_9BACL|nr:C39 family peptidase [Tumebacillus amylolyticus]MBL0385922.1 C39 family peptidase [Tumebacillus amylolyticus]